MLEWLPRFLPELAMVEEQTRGHKLLLYLRKRLFIGFGRVCHAFLVEKRHFEFESADLCPLRQQRYCLVGGPKFNGEHFHVCHSHNPNAVVDIVFHLFEVETGDPLVVLEVESS